MKLLRGIKPLEVRKVVGDDDEIAFDRIARDY